LTRTAGEEAEVSAGECKTVAENTPDTAQHTRGGMQFIGHSSGIIDLGDASARE
jgi:hypothetical protein